MGFRVHAPLGTTVQRARLMPMNVRRRHARAMAPALPLHLDRLRVRVRPARLERFATSALQATRERPVRLHAVRALRARTVRLRDCLVV
jgi:hypothetical protein